MFRHRVEWGQEAEIVPSHLFYLSGCDLRCVFCIAGIKAFDPGLGEELTGVFFNDAVAWGKMRGATNIQWVGGEPTIHIPHILSVMAGCPDLPPVVWKSDFYGTPEAFALLDAVVDTYVADLKFGNNACAHRLAGVSDYIEVVHRNLTDVASAGKKLIVRHLMLPGHESCCFAPIVDWLKENLAATPVSLWDGYLPSWRSAHFSELAGPLGPAEARRAQSLARSAGLKVL